MGCWPGSILSVRTRRLRSCRRGAVAVEFALITPMFLTLIMAMIEYATIFYSYGVMHDAARDVVRRVAVNATSVAAAEDAVLARLPAWSRDATSVTIDQTVPDTPGVNIISIRVSADASAATVLPWLTRVSDFEIATQAEMRQELPFEELEP